MGDNVVTLSDATGPESECLLKVRCMSTAGTQQVSATHANTGYTDHLPTSTDFTNTLLVFLSHCLGLLSTLLRPIHRCLLLGRLHVMC